MCSLRHFYLLLSFYYCFNLFSYWLIRRGIAFTTFDPLYHLYPLHDLFFIHIVMPINPESVQRKMKKFMSNEPLSNYSLLIIKNLITLLNGEGWFNTAYSSLGLNSWVGGWLFNWGSCFNFLRITSSFLSSNKSVSYFLSSELFTI